MENLVIIRDGELFTDSSIIAEGTQNEHRAVKQLIQRYKVQFAKLGSIGISNADSNGNRKSTLYYLNEPQATFLMTLFKNNTIVVAFKLELVERFYKMRQFILGKQSPEWQAAREESKDIRLFATDTIKRLVEYAKAQGSTHADMLYITYSKLIKSLAGYDSRNTADGWTLFKVMTYERIMQGIITEEMSHGTPYKDIYQTVKQELTGYAFMMDRRERVISAPQPPQITTIGPIYRPAARTD